MMDDFLFVLFVLFIQNVRLLHIYVIVYRMCFFLRYYAIDGMQEML